MRKNQCFYVGLTNSRMCCHDYKTLLSEYKAWGDLTLAYHSKFSFVPSDGPSSVKSSFLTPSDQIRSVTLSCPTLCNPMNRSTPGLPVHHQLPEFTQTHVHRVSDAIQPSHPLSSPSPPAPNPSQHQSLFQ